MVQPPQPHDGGKPKGSGKQSAQPALVLPQGTRPNPQPPLALPQRTRPDPRPSLMLPQGRQANPQPQPMLPQGFRPNPPPQLALPQGTSTDNLQQALAPTRATQSNRQHVPPSPYGQPPPKKHQAVANPQDPQFPQPSNIPPAPTPGATAALFTTTTTAAAAAAAATVAPNNLEPPGDQIIARACKHCADHGLTCDALRLNKAKSREYRYECTNCCERRHTSGDPDLECIFLSNRTASAASSHFGGGGSNTGGNVQTDRLGHFTYRRFHPLDPPHWNDPVTGAGTGDIPARCDLCALTGKLCDVDSVLRKSKGGHDKLPKNMSCAIGGRLMKNRHPKVRNGADPWSRHACDHCEDLTKNRRNVPVEDMCSWLLDRNTWGGPCNHCQAAGRTCLRKGREVVPPNHETQQNIGTHPGMVNQDDDDTDEQQQ
ncbi:hypothetical protein N3K66_000506 [Trichothecium roseum]|uniref:Uncharacterized protein n=1 Tax=Trichothecium roseum TaxID=47278 RepID=A0ACC0VC69_9HYPO|nr:hypothetical protein N3K66_000506 [Trichothecium roseum]